MYHIFPNMANGSLFGISVSVILTISRYNFDRNEKYL